MKIYSRIIPAVRRCLGIYCICYCQDTDRRDLSTSIGYNPVPSLGPLLQEIGKGCTECGACKKPALFYLIMVLRKAL
jgi:NAD(P)H-nitrite reductase large subunit